jgi:hypothetical protein
MKILKALQNSNFKAFLMVYKKIGRGLASAHDFVFLADDEQSDKNQPKNYAACNKA